MKQFSLFLGVAMAAISISDAWAVGISGLVEPAVTKAAPEKPVIKTQPAPKAVVPKVVQKAPALVAKVKPAQPIKPAPKATTSVISKTTEPTLALLPAVPTARIVAKPLTQVPLPSPVVQRRLVLQATALTKQGRLDQAKRTVRSLQTDPARDITAAVAALQKDHKTVVGLLYPAYYYGEHDPAANQGLYTLAQSLVAMRERHALNALLKRRQDILDEDASLAQKISQLK